MTLKEKKVIADKNERELLIAFFLHFRENGEKNLGMTIEGFVDDFMKKKDPTNK